MEQEYEPVGRHKNILFSKKNPWEKVFGDCSVVDKYLFEKPISSKWILPHFANVMLRSIGQLAFVNNPLSGLLIFVALFHSNWKVALGAILGGGVATVAEMFLRLQNWSLMRSGVAPFNAVLVGIGFQALSPMILQNEDHQLVILILTVLGSMLSIYICSALNNILGRFSIPYFALPFNIIIMTFFTLLRQTTLVHQPAWSLDYEATNLTTMMVNGTSNTTDASIDWSKVMWGMWSSIGQIWIVEADSFGLSMISIAMFIASPLLLVTAGVGAAIGTLGALLVSTVLPEQSSQVMLEEVYAGIWGFNTVLSMTSLSCVFLAFNGSSVLLGVLNSISTMLVHFALATILTSQYGIPVCTLPFTITSMLFVVTSDVKSRLARIQDAMGYPERHAYRRYTLTKSQRREARRKASDLRHQSLEGGNEISSPLE